MNYKTVVVLVKTEDPWDKLTVLNQELRDENFTGEVVLRYESGFPQEVSLNEKIRL